ncbi:MAG TPA: TIGR03435 family protein [Bryobacteraceae bacterium]|nr:TIGR03435 family protein [Bryobacteraceae bacterium]
MGTLAQRILSIAITTMALHAQSALEFEVASVRPSNPDQGFINSTTSSLRVDANHNVTFVQTTLRDLIMLAYGVGAPQIQGPNFLYVRPDAPGDRFDVIAKVPDGATREQVPLMLRALLAERFHLSFHRESKTMQIFALEVAKGGPKMKESNPGATGEARCTRSFAEREGATFAAVCNRMTSADIAQQLQALAPGYFRDGPVVDLTGLDGLYDFKIEWINRGQADNGSPGPTMFDAVQDQLGLKLERRRQPVELLVIDKLDRTPTAN